jgi:hypothetical protein
MIALHRHGGRLRSRSPVTHRGPNALPVPERRAAVPCCFRAWTGTAPTCTTATHSTRHAPQAHTKAQEREPCSLTTDSAPPITACHLPRYHQLSGCNTPPGHLVSTQHGRFRIRWVAELHHRGQSCPVQRDRQAHASAKLGLSGAETPRPRTISAASSHNPRA